MAERMIVRQNIKNEIGFWVVDPQSTEELPVQGLHEITPYGMMLVSLATCTAQVVLSYAQNHDVPVEQVEFHMAYERNYLKDCENCERINQYEEKIIEKIEFFGDLSPEDKDKLFKIAHHCPIAKIFQQGIKIQSQLTQV